MLYQVIEDGEITSSYGMPAHDDAYHIMLGFEEYSNHKGEIDDFTEIGVNTNTTPVGNSAAADTTNHEVDITSGTAPNTREYWKTKKSYSVDSKRLSGNFIARNVVAVGGSAEIGFINPTGYGYGLEGAYFQKAGADWFASVGDSSGAGQAFGVTITEGDLLAVTLTDSIALFYINGVLKKTHQLNLPSNVSCGSCAMIGTGSAAVTISADLISFKKSQA